MAQLAQIDLGGIPPPPGLTRSDGYVTYAEDDPEAYHPLTEFPAEEAPEDGHADPEEDGHADPEEDGPDLGEIPPRPTCGLVRLISDYRPGIGHVAITEEQMRADLAEHEARLAHEAYEAAQWAEFSEECQREKREWNKLHGPSWQRSSWDASDEEDDELPDDRYYDDELPGDRPREQEYCDWRRKKNPSYRHCDEFTVPPAQEQLYLEFRTTVIERGRWAEPGLAELRKAWETFLVARGLEIVLG